MGVRRSIRRFVRRKLRTFKRKRFSQRVRRVIAEDSKPQYLVRKRAADVIAFDDRQGADYYSPNAADYQYNPSFMDFHDAASLKDAIGYSDTTSGTQANLGHVRVTGRQVLTVRLWGGGDTPGFSVPEVFVELYRCVPRKALSADDTVPDPDNPGTGDRIDYPQLSFKNGFSTDEKDPGFDYHNRVGITPFMNSNFTALWKITKVRRFTLTVQKPYRVFRMKKVFDFDWRKWTSLTTTTQMPTQSVNWLCVIRGAVGLANGDRVGNVRARVLCEAVNTFKWMPLVQKGLPYTVVSYGSAPDVNGLSLTTTSPAADAGRPIA